MNSRAVALMLVCFLGASALVAPAWGQARRGETTARQRQADADAEAKQQALADGLAEANRLVAAQQYAEAEAVLAELQPDDPENVELLFMRGELLLALGRADDSIETLLRVTELQPERKRTHFQLASAFAATGQVTAALEAFERELQLTEDAEIIRLARLNRSMLLQQSQKWEPAAAELEALLIARPDQSPVFGDLATLYLQSDKLDEAAGALQRGEQAGYTSGQHYYSVGARFYKEERIEEATRLLTRAVELAPDLSRAERSLAACLDKMGRTEEALQHLRRYLELEPNAPDAQKIRDRLGS